MIKVKREQVIRAYVDDEGLVHIHAKDLDLEEMVKAGVMSSEDAEHLRNSSTVFTMSPEDSERVMNSLAAFTNAKDAEERKDE